VFREQAAASMGGYKGKNKAERIALAKASTDAWQKSMPHADSAIGRAKKSRYNRREEARKKGANSTIVGRRISRPIAVKWVPKLGQTAKDLLVAEIMKPAKRKGGKK